MQVHSLSFSHWRNCTPGRERGAAWRNTSTRLGEYWIGLRTTATLMATDIWNIKPAQPTVQNIKVGATLIMRSSIQTARKSKLQSRLVKFRDIGSQPNRLWLWHPLYWASQVTQSHTGTTRANSNDDLTATSGCRMKTVLRLGLIRSRGQSELLRQTPHKP